MTKTGSKCFNCTPDLAADFYAGEPSSYSVERQKKHDLGYWMTVIGFAVVVSGGLFGSFIGMEVLDALKIAGVGLTVFVIGVEMALRHGKHRHPFHHDTE